MVTFFCGFEWHRFGDAPAFRTSFSREHTNRKREDPDKTQDQS